MHTERYVVPLSHDEVRLLELDQRRDWKENHLSYHSNNWSLKPIVNASPL